MKNAIPDSCREEWSKDFEYFVGFDLFFQHSEQISKFAASPRNVDVFTFLRKPKIWWRQIRKTLRGRVYLEIPVQRLLEQLTECNSVKQRGPKADRFLQELIVKFGRVGERPLVVRIWISVTRISVTLYIKKVYKYKLSLLCWVTLNRVTLIRLPRGCSLTLPNFGIWCFTKEFPLYFVL